ncbi:MAG: NAD(P)/FAD-dependent oxidoreductase, partial [Rhizobiaceae bacterium]|nr:NAD(P)/FAD-dependent oxidoreductase [Rhizobiaceae bacterium]
MKQQTTAMPENCVAVIGAGPGGLAAAKWLITHGLEPVVFEASARMGGQWNSACATSAVWPGMRTNTSRIMTAFSDLDHAPGSATYLTQDEMLDYLERYAFVSGLLPKLRLSTRVESLEPAAGGDGWLVRSASGGRERSEVFRRVVVATGRCGTPSVPEISGLSGFSGSLGAVHAAQYNGVERYRGRHVLVAGCSISALEIASELAYGGARVTVANRRQRYVLTKLISGVPAEHVMFNRAAALLGGVLPPPELAAGLRAKVLAVAGNPAQFGAPAPDDD